MDLDSVMVFTSFAWTVYQIIKEIHDHVKQKRRSDEGKKCHKSKPKSKRRK